MGNTMNIHRIFLVIAMGFIFSFVKAQDSPLTNEAARLCQEKNFESAKAKINQAMDTEEAKDPYMWYVKGFIYKEIYKQNESTKRDSRNREIAVECFNKSLDIDKKKEYTEMSNAGIKYLATTYYNDALTRTRDFDLSTVHEAEELFNKFRKQMRTVDPVFPIRNYEKEFSKNVAQRYFLLWQLDVDNETIAEQALAQYSIALRIDSNDVDTQYNVGVIYYNRAVFKYRKINADTDFIDLIDIQQDCANLIKNKALVYMNQAYKLSPERGDIVRGLMYIHRALEHEKDVEYFKTEIERLINEGKLVEPDNRE